MLPDTLPASPLALFRTWFDDAQTRIDTKNPNAMVIASIDTSAGAPRADGRVVLCKALDTELGHLTFYTNYASRKGRQLSATPRAAAVFFWDDLERQIRIEGPVTRSPAADSDAYFASRGAGAKVGAWASRQSEPVDGRATMLRQVAETAARFDIPHDGGKVAYGLQGEVPRPPHWGGLRLWIQSIELWAGGEHRIHDRARWRRALELDTEGRLLAAGTWDASRLQP